jgi:hypothetical protein
MHFTYLYATVFPGSMDSCVGSSHKVMSWFEKSSCIPSQTLLFRT